MMNYPSPFPHGYRIRVLHSSRARKPMALPRLDLITDDACTDMVLGKKCPSGADKKGSPDTGSF